MIGAQLAVLRSGGLRPKARSSIYATVRGGSERFHVISSVALGGEVRTQRVLPIYRPLLHDVYKRCAEGYAIEIQQYNIILLCFI